MSGAALHMDRIYRRQRHIYDLTRKYYLLGRDALIRELDPPPGGSILEIGCGTGRNLIAAARRYPDARLYGLDISGQMLETARQSIARSGLSGRIMLARGDATCFDGAALFGLPAYDRLFCSYTLSMMPGWRTALECAAHHVATGGRLHIVDFGQQERLPRWFRAGLFAWLARFQVTPRALLREALVEIAVDPALRLTWRAMLGGYAWGATVTRS